MNEHPLPEGKLPYPIHTGSAPFRDLARGLDVEATRLPAEARREVASQALRQLEMLDELYHQLAERARGILDRARRDLELHDVPCFCRKGRGQVYYLYQEPGPEDRRFFSLLAPHEYRQANPRVSFQGGFRLNEDSTWTPMDSE